jgi:hypothetical protein
LFLFPVPVIINQFLGEATGILHASPLGTFHHHRLAVSALGPPQDQKLRIGGVDPGEILGSLGFVENLWKKNEKNTIPMDPNTV